MMHKYLWAGCAAVALTMGAAGQPAAAGPRQPVLVELFTSEGCSSCPPADALLERLDRTQPVAGAWIIVLSEHVDYWNHIGWADPWSSAAFSARQEMYARRFGLDGVYTPQMVVNGTAEFVGSDARKAEAAIRSCLRQPAIAVHAGPSRHGSLAVEVDLLPPGKNRKADVYVAQAADRGTSDVLGGENLGRRLHHVAILRQLRHVGTVSQSSGFKADFPLPRTADGGSRWIAFVQEPAGGSILGASVFRAGKSPEGQ